MDSYVKATQNRSLRTIRTELEFLEDSSVLTSAQVASILAILPESSSSSSRAQSNTQLAVQPTPSPVPTQNALRNTLSEKQSQPQPQQQPYQPPPPAYNQAPTLATGVALYAYQPTDAGDLALQAQDRVHVLENINADWARGRNERTSEEGIFPRSYISVSEERNQPPGLPYRQNMQQGLQQGQQQNGTAYGNMPVDVAQGNAPVQNGDGHSNMNEHGKKFGKKLGNAAIFGAGATLGSNIVNSIF